MHSKSSGRGNYLMLGFIFITALMVFSMYASFFRTIKSPATFTNPIQFKIPTQTKAPKVTNSPPKIVTQQSPKGFHFVFNSDCSRKPGYNFASFIMFYTFLTMYPDPESGHTMTELYSCDKEQYFVPPWHAPGVLPPHCKLARVNTFSKFNSTMAAQGYLPYNKPVGFTQLLAGDWATKHDDDVIVILDPDFYFLKPLSPLYLKVKENEMVNGFYGVGSWQLRGNVKSVVDSICPTCTNLSPEKASTYCAGVPNILRLGGLRKLVPYWVENTFVLYGATRGWQEEQYAYIVAAAHLNFDSSVKKDLFVSEGEEGDGSDFTYIHYCQQLKLNDGWRFWKHEFTIEAPGSKEFGRKIFDTQNVPEFAFSCDKKIVVTVPVAKMNLTGEAFNGFLYITMARAVNGANLFWHQLFCNGTKIIR